RARRALRGKVGQGQAFALPTWQRLNLGLLGTIQVQDLALALERNARLRQGFAALLGVAHGVIRLDVTLAKALAEQRDAQHLAIELRLLLVEHPTQSLHDALLGTDQGRNRASQPRGVREKLFLQAAHTSPPWRGN